MGSETLPSACYILSDESSIPFYSMSNGYKYPTSVLSTIWTNKVSCHCFNTTSINCSTARITHSWILTFNHQRHLFQAKNIKFAIKIFFWFTQFHPFACCFWRWSSSFWCRFFFSPVDSYFLATLIFFEYALFLVFKFFWILASFLTCLGHIFRWC